MLHTRNPDTYLRAYWLVVLALVAVRVALAFKLVSRVADNFDAYVLGEQPEKDRPAARRRRATSRIAKNSSSQ